VGTVNELLIISGSEIARRIRDGRLTSRDALEAHIEHIERVNPRINAVVQQRFELARREADSADAAMSTGDALPVFHGVPCTIKECFALTGMPNSAGLVARKDVIATEDATAVARVRAAGAIPMGVTNTSELCMWMESVNNVYGRTNNPYDRRHICGGSSGGEGAIIGAGGSPFGVGSDVGGSIRGPAFFNGVFGHKPTGGLVPGTGQHPIAENGALRYLVTGPLCRRAEDLLPLLRIMAGPDGQDSGCVDGLVGDADQVDLDGRRLVTVVDNGKIAVHPELRRAQRRVADALEARGMVIIEARFEALKKQFDIWSAMMSRENVTTFGTLLGEGRSIHPLWELAKLCVGRSDHTLMASMLALVDPITKRMPRYAGKLVDQGRRLRDEIVATLGEGGVMLYPSHSTPAPRHNEPVRQALRLHMPFAYLAIFNVLELPSTQVPLGLGQQGLPLGVQVVSTHGQDHVTIAVAQALEADLGGWTPPAD